MATYDSSVQESIKSQLVTRIVSLEGLLQKEREEHEATRQQLLKVTNDHENAKNDLRWAALDNKKLREDRHLVGQMARSEQKQLQDHLDDSFKTINRLRETNYHLTKKVESLENFEKDKEIQKLKVELVESKMKQVPESEVQKRLKEEINDIRSIMESILLREVESQAFYEGRINEQQAQIEALMSQQNSQMGYQELYQEGVEQYPEQFDQEANGNNGWVQPYYPHQAVYAASDDVKSDKSSGSWQVEHLPTGDQEGATESVENMQ